MDNNELDIIRQEVKNDMNLPLYLKLAEFDIKNVSLTRKFAISQDYQTRSYIIEKFYKPTELYEICN